MDIVDGNIIRSTDGKALMSLKELATDRPVQRRQERAHYRRVHVYHPIKSNAYSFGCTFVDIEVDIPMCKVTLRDIVNVHDCGKLINPALAEAQVHGGMSMAIGYGMGEQLLFDEKNGKPLNNNLLDYKLSAPLWITPDLRGAVHRKCRSLPRAFGTKALGEPPACSGAPAIRNAILNATGVASRPDTPMNAAHPLQAVQRRGAHSGLRRDKLCMI